MTLDPDTATYVKRLMREQGLTFKEALNDAIRNSAQARKRSRATHRFRTPTAPLGNPTVNLDRALQLAGELEDEELVRRSRLGK